MSTWTQENPTAIALTAGQLGGDVTYPLAFSAVPFQVLPQVIPPSDSGSVIFAVPYAITATGFSYLLSGPPPDDSHVLVWTATANQPAPADDDETDTCCNPCTCVGY